jgi:hypothetical protein
MNIWEDSNNMGFKIDSDKVYTFNLARSMDDVRVYKKLGKHLYKHEIDLLHGEYIMNSKSYSTYRDMTKEEFIKIFNKVWKETEEELDEKFNRPSVIYTFPKNMEEFHKAIQEEFNKSLNKDEGQSDKV